MSDQYANSGNIISPKFRMTYPHLLKPQVFRADPTSRPSFKVGGLFPPGVDWPEGRKACYDAAAVEWGPDPAKWPKNPPVQPGAEGPAGQPQPLDTPFKDQGVVGWQEDGTLKKGYVQGALFIQPSTGEKFPPVIVGPDGRTEITDEKEIYGGRWACVSVRAKAWTFGKRHGVKLYLQAVQLLEHDEPFGTRGEPEKEFTPVAIAGKAPVTAPQVFAEQTPGDNSPGTPPAANPFG